jgi:hypothetical protein
MPNLNLNIQSVLGEDFITSDEVIVDNTKAGQVAVFRNPAKNGAVEALVLTTESQLEYLSHDSTSLTGWTLVPLSNASGQPIIASEVIAVATPGGLVDGFYIGADGALEHASLTPSGWTFNPVPEAPNGLSQLRAAFSPGASGNSVVIYACDNDGNVFIYYGAGGNWSGGTMPVGGPTSNITLALKDQGAGNLPSWMLTIVAASNYTLRPGGQGQDPVGTVIENSVAWIEGALALSNNTLIINPTSTKISQQSASRVLLNATHMAGAASTMIVTLELPPDPNQGALVGCLIDDPDQSYNTVPGTAFASAVVVESTDGFATVYGINSQMDLFVLRQVAFNAADMNPGFGASQTWGPVLQLDQGISRMYADQSISDAPALIGVDAAIGALHLYVMDPATSFWRIIPIHLPTSTQTPLNRWRTEITLFDENGCPLPNTELKVTASSSVDVEINGFYQVINETDGAAIQTNSLGKATIASLATSLTPPAFTVAAEGLAAQTHSPAGDINNYLAGKGSLIGKDAFDTAVFTQLKADASIDFQTALTAIQQCAGLVPQNGPPQQVSGAGHVSGSPVHLFTRIAGRTTHIPCGSRGEAEKLLRSDLSIASDWDDVWDKEKRFAGDVWHAIKAGVQDVQHVIVDTVSKSVTIYLKIEDDLVRLAAWAVKSVEDAMHAITGVFNWLKVKIDDVIDWFKAVFNFQAIWNTKEVIAQQLRAIPDYFNAQFADWSHKIDQNFFTNQRAKIDKYFQDLMAKYADQGLTSLPGWAPMGHKPDSTPVAGTATRQDLTGNVHANWFQDKLSSHAHDDPNLPTTGDDSSDPIHTFFNSAGESGAALLKAFKDFKDGVVSLFDVKNPASFETILISELLQLAQDLVDAILAIFDTLVQGLLALGELAMNGFADLLDHELKFGFVNDIYTWIAQRGASANSPSPTLTVKDLIALLAAFPATIIYNLATGGDKGPFPNGALPSGSGAATTCYAIPSHDVQKAFGTVAGVMTGIGGIWTMASDASPTAPQWISYASKGTTAIRLAFTHPGWLNWGPLQWAGVGAAAANLLWIGPAAFFINQSLDFTTTVKSNIMSLIPSSLNWEFDDLTKILSSVFGVASLGFTTASVMTTLCEGSIPPPLKTTAALAEGIVSPYSFLTMKEFVDDPEIGVFVVPLKLALDALGCFGGAALEVAGAFTEFQDPS